MKPIIASIQDQINNAGAGTGAQTDANVTVSTALNVVFGIIAVIAVIMIVVGGINYSTSQGDPGKISRAKNTVLYGIIGLVIALLAFAVVNFVIKAI